jgi:hypothetical protein
MTAPERAPDRALDWHEANQRWLTATVSRLRRWLEHQLALAESGTEADVPDDGLEVSSAPADANAPEALAAEMAAPPALETLCGLFGLSAFERQVLLLCAGVELDSRLATVCAAAGADAPHGQPSFALALALLPDAHWSVLSPDRPLRRWRMVELVSAQGITRSALRIDERVLSYMTGVPHLDERLSGYVEPIKVASDLSPSQASVAERAIAAWSRVEEAARLPVVQLCGGDTPALTAVAAATAARLGLDLHLTTAEALPVEPRELTALMRLWEREAALSESALLLDCTDLDGSERARQTAVGRFIDGVHCPLLVGGRDRVRAGQRPVVVLDVPEPTPVEQKRLWEEALGAVGHRLNGELDGLAASFRLGVAEIRAAAAEALTEMESAGGFETAGDAGLCRRLWDSARRRARPGLYQLAQRLEPAAGWDELVLPEAQLRLLREIDIHVRHRLKVYDTWGLAAKDARGLGVSALFHGPSGTGKTMAAEVLANALAMDLYRIDLSRVVDKYIGETEKNLRRVFDAAEGSGAILLFDEADALFGKRSEVRDSHDRYANIEIGYLLQRMEAYRGLAILTTNRKASLDNAFLRRLRFVVAFPFPDVPQRAEIWGRMFPPRTPIAGLDLDRLARLNVTGGNIRNMTLHAAFLAAEEQTPVQMRHLRRAAQVEYAKLDKTLTNAEVADWS